MSEESFKSVFINSAVNPKGEPFCVVSVRTDKDRILLAQLDVKEVRDMAMQWLSAAEAAEQDAAALRTIRRLELPDDLARALVSELRETRSE